MDNAESAAGFVIMQLYEYGMPGMPKRIGYADGRRIRALLCTGEALQSDYGQVHVGFVAAKAGVAVATGGSVPTAFSTGFSEAFARMCERIYNRQGVAGLIRIALGMASPFALMAYVSHCVTVGGLSYTSTKAIPNITDTGRTSWSWTDAHTVFGNANVFGGSNGNRKSQGVFIAWG